MWLLEQLAPGTGVNNIPLAVRVGGRFRWWALQTALDAVLRRHEVLRTVMSEDEAGLHQRIAPSDAISIEVEVRGTSPAELDADLLAFTAEPFRLGQPLVRAAHFTCVDGDVFCFVAHHSVFDAKSAGILLNDFRLAYDAHAADLDTPVEVLVEQRAEPAAVPDARTVEHWRELLSGVDTAALALRCGDDPPVAPTLAGGRVTHELSSEAITALSSLRRDLRATDNIVLMAAYCLLLAAHGVGSDIVIGVPLDSRGPDDRNLVGLHINTLPLRLAVSSGDTFREVVRRAREVFLDAVSHGGISTEQILEHLPRRDETWRCPLFRHMFNYLPVEDGGFTMAGMPAELVEVDTGASRVDLEFFILPSTNSTRVKAIFSSEVFEAADVRAMLLRFDALLCELGANPDQEVAALSVGTTEERSVLSRVAYGPRVEVEASVLELVASAAEEMPDNIAFRVDGRDVTYAALWGTVKRLQRELLAADVGPGAVVALVGNRSAEFAAAVLAVWMTGACFLPLDGTQPVQRLGYQVRDAGAVVALAEDPSAVDLGGLPVFSFGALADTNPEWKPHDAPVVDLRSSAYVMYTSGSTGRPKGVVITHANLANVVLHFADELAVTVDHCALWSTAPTFDPSLLELFMPLVVGGRVAVAADEVRADGAAMRAALLDSDADIVQATPTTWRAVLDDVADVLDGRTVLSGGEALPAALGSRLVEQGCRVFNVYGPTEATIWCTAAELVEPPTDVVPVGSPISNTTVFITDEHGRELPPGLRGELCVGGFNVGVGYLNQPETTAAKFVEHPRHGRCYRTGDVARWRHDGTLEVLGRSDRQVKLRGNRIELGEVEHVLVEHEAVTAAAVTAIGDMSGDGRIIAFVQVDDQRVTADELWDHARSRLPDAVIPTLFHVLGALPVNSSGKVDYPALAATADDTTARGEAPGPGDDAQDTRLLVDLWRETLGRDDISERSNFFASGGHSLSAAKLVLRIRRETGRDVQLHDVFSAPTPSRLARLLTDRDGRPAPAPGRS
ncbi:Dimodular nonribosomal peptide synthase [Actinosynnema sp. ALI-1.44]